MGKDFLKNILKRDKLQFLLAEVNTITIQSSKYRMLETDKKSV
jgi:hypothetical protein